MTSEWARLGEATGVTLWEFSVDDQRPRMVEAAAEVGTLDDNTGAPIVRPRHLLASGLAYWLEPLPAGIHSLMTAPRAADGGAVLWDDSCEVIEDECQGYADIVLALVT